MLVGSQYATAILINVHGSPTVFSDSTVFNNNPNTATTGEVAAVVSIRKIPPINVVYAYSCDTCAGGSTGWATAFGIGADAVGRAYVGFDKTAAFRNGVNATNSFWATLKKGETVKMAMKKAQDEYEVDGNNGAKLVLIGDPDTTLFKNIYKHTKTAWFVLNQ